MNRKYFTYTLGDNVAYPFKTYNYAPAEPNDHVCDFGDGDAFDIRLHALVYKGPSAKPQLTISTHINDDFVVIAMGVVHKVDCQLSFP